LWIPDVVLEQVKAAALEKCKDDRVFFLNPSLADMLHARVYLLRDQGETFLVPLWHDEVYFDSAKEGGEEIIVKCVPDLPSCVTIDEENRLHISITLRLDASLLTKRDIPVEVADHVFWLPVGALHIRPFQHITLRNVGLPRIDTHNIENTEPRGDVILSVRLL
jgi:hypothetical protein